MEPKYIKHCLKVLKADLERESMKLLKYELEQIVEAQQKQIDQHGKYLTTTRDEDLSKLKTAAVLNKARLEAAQHILVFFNEDYIEDAIKSTELIIQKGEINE